MKTQHATQLSAEDGRLVDLVTEALVDPDLNTATRMRLEEEISRLLRTTREDTHGPSSQKTDAERPDAHEHPLPRVLESVLIDPDLNTDRRMRLHGEISDLVEKAR